MLNLKQKIHLTGAFALCALSACSSDSPSTAGSTTIPNATAKQIEFTTAATSSIPVDGGELKIFEEEDGASANCSANGITYSSEIQINSNKLVVTHLKLENAGKLCSGIFTRFKAACGTIPDWWEGCDENGNLELFCGDHRMETLTKCTWTDPPKCTTKEGDTTITFSMVVSDFSGSATDICNKIVNAEASNDDAETPSSSSTGDESSSSVEPSDSLKGIAVPMD